MPRSNRIFASKSRIRDSKIVSHWSKRFLFQSLSLGFVFDEFPCRHDIYSNQDIPPAQASYDDDGRYEYLGVLYDLEFHFILGSRSLLYR